jgi:hypothetical protein
MLLNLTIIVLISLKPLSSAYLSQVVHASRLLRNWIFAIQEKEISEII